jgi:hypothetical protein
MSHNRLMKETCNSCGKTFEFYSDECYNCKQSPTTWKCNGGNCDFVEFICEDCERKENNYGTNRSYPTVQRDKAGNRRS